MKKLAVLLLVVGLIFFSGSVMAQNQGYLEAKLGIDVMGESEFGSNPAEDVEMGYTLTGEYKVPMDAMWTYGAGLSYQLDRELEDISDSEFNFTPFYALAQYNLQDTRTYLLGHLGYNLYDGNATGDYNGGLYYGLGAGFNFGQKSQYVAEFLYSVNSGEYEDDGTTNDVDYSKITMAFGMKF